MNKKFDYSYKFMNVVSECREEVYNDIQGVMHVDKTCRVQTVDKEDNFLFLKFFPVCLDKKNF